MALNSTIFKADLQVSDLDRHYYASHGLTIARHPSETDERMMVRLLAFALYADEQLAFGKGLSADDEPDLWKKDYSGEIELWIDVGLPDEKLIRRACGRARQVVILVYGGQAADIWWDKNKSGFTRLDNLAVRRVSQEDCAALAALAERGMSLQAMIQDGVLHLTGGDDALEISLQTLKEAR